MNDVEYKAAGMLLKLASDSYANRGCNDFILPNTPEHQELWTACMTWSEGRAPENGPGTGESIYFLDWLLMGYLAHVLDKERSHTLAGPSRDEVLGMCKTAIALEPDVDKALKIVMTVANGACNPKIARIALEAELLRERHLRMRPTVDVTKDSGPAIIFEGDAYKGDEDDGIVEVSIDPEETEEHGVWALFRSSSPDGQHPFADLLQNKRVEVTFKVLGPVTPPKKEFIDIRIERTGERLQGAKRQHVPYVVKALCACGAEKEINLSKQYLSYPVWGETDSVTLYCDGCELEQECRLSVDVSVQLL